MPWFSSYLATALVKDILPLDKHKLLYGPVFLLAIAPKFQPMLTQQLVVYYDLKKKMCREF